MPVCARVISVIDSQGQTVPGALAIDPTAADFGSCTYVLQTGAEWAYGSLLTMTPDDALVYSGGIALVWCTAWAFKVAIRALNVGDTNEQND